MKTIRAIILLFILVIQSFTVSSQTLYETKFSDTKGNKYVGFLVYYSESYAYMRIGLYLNGKYHVANVDYTLYTTYENGYNYTFLFGENPSYITNVPKGYTYTPEHFFWIYGDDYSTLKPYFTTDTEFKFENIYEVEYFKEIGLLDLTEDYLKQFYYTYEDDYINFVQALNWQNETYDNYYVENDPTLHLFIVANTKIGDIGQSCTIDKNTYISEFEGVASALEIDIKEYIIDGDYFSKKNLLSELNKLNPGSNDIIVFLYSGHGFRWDDQKDSYPYLDLRSNNYMAIDNSTYISLSELYGLIVAKGARLNLIVNNSCNSSIGVNQVTNSTFLATMSNNNFKKENLRILFLESSGNLLANAASPKEYAWCNNANGGFFTQSFLQAFRQEIAILNSTKPSWDKIMNNTISYTRTKSTTCVNCEQQNGIMYSTIVTK